MEDWIDIENCLPAEGGSYLTYSPSGYWNQQVHVWLEKERAWEHEWLKKKRSEIKPKTWITHWMPLPENP